MRIEKRMHRHASTRSCPREQHNRESGTNKNMGRAERNSWSTKMTRAKEQVACKMTL